MIQLRSRSSLEELRKPRRGTYSSDRQTELTHRMESWRTSIEELFDELGDRSTGGPIFRKLSDLL